MSVPVEKTPRECWEDALGFVGVALLARPSMKAGSSAPDHESATRTYVYAVDQLIDTLEAMARRGQLDDIGAFLDVQFGRV